MSELYELYKEEILDHNRKPRNFRKLEEANRVSEGFNPLCGDRVIVYVYLENDVVKNISFEGQGCAISKACASMMTESVKGKTKAETEALFQKVHKMLTSSPHEPVDSSGLGKLAVFSGVREFPLRVKCATLAWHTLNAAFQGKGEGVSTE